ncbi:FAD-binding domain-containing protein [Xylariaceae sp. FL0016]|nr:FAD-binding domain-containing protein [Xylariaceae sp. FL0016]
MRVFSVVLSFAAGIVAARSTHPIAELAARGVRSAALDTLYLKSGLDEACYCSLACNTLAETFGPDQVSGANDEAYDAALARFWSLQQSADTKPRCFFHPDNAKEVAVAVLLSRATQCPFAVKGAGHAAFKGASNSDGGITIDFIHMTHVIPSSDRKSVAFGPGNNWHHVYATLEKENLTMVGGRVASVGVGGLLLGGGISFFSGQYGWACDNIIDYEVVLASGEIVNVNAVTNPDLFWALRGGGGNFGIVTQFIANTFEQGQMWGGDMGWELQSSKDAAIDALVEFAETGALRDPKAALILSFAYAQVYNMWVAVAMMEHSEPHDVGKHPETFDKFVNIENHFQNTLRTSSQSDLTAQIDKLSPFGMRNSYWAMTTFIDRQLLSDMLDIYQEETKKVSNLTGIVPSLVYQVVSVSTLKGMLRNGGNALGIGGGDRPLLIINIAVTWALESEDEAILAAIHRMLTRMKSLAQQRNLYHPFLYMNYASAWQDPVAGYGSENKARLLEISKKYDPEWISQKLHPGYFKLNGAPLEWER